MIKNLAEYFSPEQEFYLKKVKYDRFENNIQKEEYTLNCIDTIEANMHGENITVIVTRRLKFEPEEMFDLVVSFGADLKFNKDKMSEHEWPKINLAEEFRNNGEFVTNNLVSRISLLIAQITSSFGQQPLVLPPSIVKGN